MTVINLNILRIIKKIVDLRSKEFVNVDVICNPIYFSRLCIYFGNFKESIYKEYTIYEHASIF